MLLCVPLFVTHRQDEPVLEVGELFVTLLTTVHAVLLVHHLLVAVRAGAGLVQAVLLTQVHYGGDAVEIVRLHTQTHRHTNTHEYSNFPSMSGFCAARHSLGAMPPSND